MSGGGSLGAQGHVGLPQVGGRWCFGVVIMMSSLLFLLYVAALGPDVVRKSLMQLDRQQVLDVRSLPRKLGNEFTQTLWRVQSGPDMLQWGRL